MLKNWRQQYIKIEKEDENFNNDDYIYMDYWSLIRKDYGNIDSSTPGLFEQYCEPMPTLTEAQIESYLTHIMEQRGTTQSSNYKRSKIGISVLHAGETTTVSSHALNYNLDYINNTQYTDGNDFDVVCFYYIWKYNRNYLDGFYEFQSAVENTIPDYSKIITNSAYVTNHNLNTYYAVKTKSGISVDPQFKIGENAYLSGGNNLINYVDTSTNYYVAKVFNKSSATPFYYSGSQIKSISLGSKSGYGTGSSQWTKNPYYLMGYPVIEYFDGYVSGSDSPTFPNFRFTCLCIVVKKNTVTERIKIF